ncbi:DUF2326 domain-containing protein [Candidatus Gracilibacteria bacterium]|jgi:uncharacterized protein YydD (DUF2326 family)|nr:DUF2326 domain-containing protein [Candidatus Gracilibacteria bacterium]
MITLKKLSFSPNTFKDKKLESVTFESGLNFIIGDKSESVKNKKEKNKMNGVGKSLLIESINFCLFKKLEDSRVNKIPDINLDPSIYFCLDFEIETEDKIKKVQIRRNRTENDPISIWVDDEEKSFDDLKDAKKYVEYLVFGSKLTEHPSLRSLLSILIREEDSLYKDILKPYHNSSLSSFEDLLKPHFYLFQINLELLDKIKKVSTDLKVTTKSLASLRSDFKNNGIAEKEVGSYINDLRDSVEKLNLAIDQLHPSEAMTQTKNEMINLQIQLEKLVATKASKEYLMRKIKSLPELEKINTKQVQIVYNYFKAGLGNLVEKSFEQVLDFKKQVDDFQNSLMGEKLKELIDEMQEIDKQISVIDEQIAKLYEKTEAREKIDNLKQAVQLEREKNIQLDKLSSTYEMLQSKIAEQKNLKKRKESLIEELEVVLFGIKVTVSSFEEDLKKMHEFIAGNKRCQFQINVAESLANFVEFEYRIKLDGSSGINRIKTFIYDCLLMINKTTSKRHLGFLIHDNIFASTGRDDMVKSLNYLSDLSKKHKFQYILTINKDEFESQIKEFSFDYKKHIRTELTRDKPFLGFEYSEL